MTLSAPASPSLSAAAVDAAAPSAPFVTSPPSAASDHRTLRTLAILSVLMAFGPISTDLYLPALPTMASALRSDAGTME